MRRSTKKYSEDKYFLLVLLLFVLLIIEPFLPKKEKETIKEKEIEINEYEIVQEFKYDDSKNSHITCVVTDRGHDIYTPNSSTAYRYGPSFMLDDDGSVDAYFSSPGNMSSEWDYIRYRHMDKDGNWGNEEIVLKPNKKSLDSCSTCDPGMFYYDGYYYLGYTSTNNNELKGYDNQIFVARSEEPYGPFEKWNGNGWGGNPAPIIEYNDDPKFWGYGEVSFVIKDETLYIYYSAYVENGSMTLVKTAPLDENWPQNISDSKLAFNKRYGQDSSEVVYVEEYSRFMSFSIANRLTDCSSLCIYESLDGINFTCSEILEGAIEPYSHSVGVTKRSDGHIKKDDQLFIGYAYGETWGKWATRIAPIEIETYVGEPRG